MVVLQEARMLTKAESCSVFLVDKITNELVAKVFDGKTPFLSLTSNFY